TPMKYVMLIYETPADFAARQRGPDSPYVAAWRAYYAALLQAGVYVDGPPLKEVATGTTVRGRDGKPRLQDGPCGEATEQLGGFRILELASLDAALEWAARCPTAATGALEVRPMAVDVHEMITEA